MDNRMLPAYRRDEHIAKGYLLVWLQRGGISPKRWQCARADQVEERWLEQDDGRWICFHQDWQVLGIEMVGMLVRHQHRIKITQGMPRVGYVPWINQNSRAISLSQHGRMA
jgi:hypothetical protein